MKFLVSIFNHLIWFHSFIPARQLFWLFLDMSFRLLMTKDDLVEREDMEFKVQCLFPLVSILERERER